jgi:Xaa-Pro aminopeptidase
VNIDRRLDRRAALVALLAARELDAFVIAHLPNVRYLTGFTGSAALVAVRRSGDLVLVTDFRYATQVAEEVGDLARVEITAGDALSRMLEVLGEDAGAARVGVEGHVVTWKTAERLRSDARRRFEPHEGLVEGLRVRKDPEEIAAIREAGRVALEALEAALALARPGVREIEVAARLELELRVRGSEWHPFPTIVASGPRSALPHAGTSDREIRRGDFLLLDFGARVDGYCADVTRTVVVGARADGRQRTVYDLVRDAQRQARERVAVGMSGREADALARSVIEAGGFGEQFGHSLGHGLGLEVHEEPRLSRTSEQTLPEGAVATIEPGVYVPGWGGVRLEDDVALTATGPELLTDGRTELRELV